MVNDEIMKPLLTLITRYREFAVYIVFGFLTTVVNYVIYIACMAFFYGNSANVVSVAVSWAAAVTFAYFTNRRYVFKSRAKGLKAVLAECAAFLSARVASGFLDLAIMFIAVDLLAYNGYIVKILSNIIVTVLNYILSKFVVFKNRIKSGD